MDHFKPQNTILVAMWCSNVPLTGSLLQFVYQQVCVPLVELEKGRSFFSIDHGKNIKVRFLFFSQKIRF